MRVQAEAIARVCHQTCKAYCESIGDKSIPEWEAAPVWQRESAIDGVRFALAHPGCTPEEAHGRWMARKLVEGWSYGLVKDAEAKLHPALVPYDQLPKEQKAKDYIFLAIVRIMRGI